MHRRVIYSVCAALVVFGSAWTVERRPNGAQSVDASDLLLANSAPSSAPAASCPGDFDCDGTVSLADFLVFAGVFGVRSGDANFNALMDLDGSGAVDLADFLAFAGVFGTTCEDRPDGSVGGDREALIALFNATDGPNLETSRCCRL